MSSYSIRYFLILEHDEVRSLPLAKLERLDREPPEDRLEELAGQRVRDAEIVVSLHNRKPERVVRSVFGYKQFREDGTVDVEHQMKDGLVVMEAGLTKLSLSEPLANVVDAGAAFARRRRDHSVWWKPSAELESYIFDCALGLAKCKRL